jgi:putative transposase
MPWGLKRYQETGNLHFITFSCYQRQPFLSAPSSRRAFEETLERVRRWYGFDVKGYVVMPEHVHLLLSEPERGSLRVVIQMLKQITAQKLRPSTVGLRESGLSDLPKRFWQVRYYDFNVRTARKQIEKLRYLHRNPVKRGLVEKPEDWLWSSFNHYATGVEGVVEIESEWTGRKRERMGMPLRVKVTGNPITFGGVPVSVGSAGPTLSPKDGEKDGAPDLL